MILEDGGYSHRNTFLFAISYISVESIPIGGLNPPKREAEVWNRWRLEHLRHVRPTEPMKALIRPFIDLALSIGSPASVRRLLYFRF
jgi:hypothetical protein